MDVSKRLAAAAGLTMWGGVFFAVFAAVLTGPVLHVAAIHWVAAGRLDRRSAPRWPR